MVRALNKAPPPLDDGLVLTPGEIRNGHTLETVRKIIVASCPTAPEYATEILRRAHHRRDIADEELRQFKQAAATIVEVADIPTPISYEGAELLREAESRRDMATKELRQFERAGKTLDVLTRAWTEANEAVGRAASRAMAAELAA
jgi:hypothetical protein